MGNALFINTAFSPSPIETIIFLVRQMFGVTEQRLNEYAIQMVEFKREQAVDKAEFKREQAALMADFRIIILESRVPPTPALPVAFPAPAFTFTTERKEIFPKLPTYHRVKREFQPWYFQVRVKLQVDFTHLSERNRFFYIHSKLRDKILIQMQTWVKTMTEREIFSVQKLFDQLILVYDNFQSMEITAKELNKMKQKNKQQFSAFISGFEKKKCWRRGGWISMIKSRKRSSTTPSIMKCIKLSSAFFIPATYTAWNEQSARNFTDEGWDEDDGN